MIVGEGEGNESGTAIYGSNRLIDEACFLVMKILPRKRVVLTHHSPGLFWLSDPKVWREKVGDYINEFLFFARKANMV